MLVTSELLAGENQSQNDLWNLVSAWQESPWKFSFAPKFNLCHFQLLSQILNLAFLDVKTLAKVINNSLSKWNIYPVLNKLSGIDNPVWTKLRTLFSIINFHLPNHCAARITMVLKKTRLYMGWSDKCFLSAHSIDIAKYTQQCRENLVGIQFRAVCNTLHSGLHLEQLPLGDVAMTSVLSGFFSFDR